MTEWDRRDLRIPAGHPAASGHFPGRPVVPGALLLDEVAQAIARVEPLCFRGVKFLAPAAFGESLELRWRHEDADRVRFEMRRPETGEVIVAGTLGGAA